MISQVLPIIRQACKETAGMEEAVENQNYSKEIAATIHDVLTEDKYEFEFDEKDGIFTFGYHVVEVVHERLLYGDWLKLCIVVMEDAFLMYAVSPRKIYYSTKRKTMEFINRVNVRLNYCKFELSNYEKGELRVSTFHKCEEGKAPSPALVRDMICTLITAMEDYGGGMGVLQEQKGLTAKEALENCETIKKKRLLDEKEYANQVAKQTEKEQSKENVGKTEVILDEETKAAVKDSLFTILKFGKLIEWCDENTVPVPEDAIQLVKSDAQVLKETDIFEFDFENDAAFVETVRKFMGLIRKGIKIQKEIRKYKAIKAALNGEDGGESEE